MRVPQRAGRGADTKAASRMSIVRAELRDKLMDEALVLMDKPAKDATRLPRLLRMIALLTRAASQARAGTVRQHRRRSRSDAACVRRRTMPSGSPLVLRKHLRVLARAGIVRDCKAGRRRLWAFCDVASVNISTPARAIP
jgi:hypothetical protein